VRDLNSEIRLLKRKLRGEIQLRQKAEEYCKELRGFLDVLETELQIKGVKSE
jgi:hypothetical protein|tara:strand:- start:31927 stop:32082 length:156 start_codon:yes stop_codon:yes gene_type:complete